MTFLQHTFRLLHLCLCTCLPTAINPLPTRQFYIIAEVPFNFCFTSESNIIILGHFKTSASNSIKPRLSILEICKEFVLFIVYIILFSISTLLLLI